MKPQILGFALSALILTPLAPAAALTYQKNFPEPPSAPATLDASHTVSINGDSLTALTWLLPQFGPSLGTLTSIDFTVTENYYWDDFFANTSGMNLDVQLAPVGSFNVAGPDGRGNAFVGVNPGAGYLIFSGSTIEIMGSAGVAGSTRHWDIGQLNTNYVGTGTVSLTVSAANGVDETVIGAGSLTQLSVTKSGKFNENVQVTYNYTAAIAPAPEPGTFFVLGGGLMALGWGRRAARHRTSAPNSDRI